MAKSRIYKPTAEAIIMASDILKKGEVVSFPTETVYGLGADATNSDAIAKIFSAKNRPSFNPLIIHLPNTQMVEKYVELSQLTKDLSNIFWPGPFTMVLPLKKNSGISTLITAGLETVAIRVPSHPVAHTLLNEFNGPIAAPSANKSGQISPTTAQHVDQEFGDELELIIDGGPCDNGLESTIVKVVYDQLTILRPGNVTVEEIQEKIEVKIVTDTQPTDNPIAPGQLKSHYAPNANVRLNVINPEMNEAYLAFGDTNQVENMLNLSPSGDLEEAASIAPIPKSGVGVAINDRLERAAAPKDLLKD